MKKMNKRSIFSFVLCAMLVFCVGVYSSAEPTTAWFSDTGSDEEIYSMKELDVTFTGDGIGEGAARLELKFDAATKIADADERAKMFEHAAKYYVFTAESSSDAENLDAAIAVDISYADSQQGDVMASADMDKGLRYFIYEINKESDVRTEGSELVPGVFVDANGKCLVKSYQGDENEFYDSKLADKIDASITDKEAFEKYTVEQQLEFLRGIQENTQKLERGEEKTYCICFWVEYDFFNSQAQDVQDSTVRELNFNVDVKITAEQFDKTTLAQQN